MSAFLKLQQRYGQKPKEEDDAPLSAFDRLQKGYRFVTQDPNAFGPPAPEPVVVEPEYTDDPSLYGMAPPVALDKIGATASSFGQEAIGGAASTIGSGIAAAGDLAGPFVDFPGSLARLAQGNEFQSPMAATASEQGRIFADTQRREEAQRIRAEAGIAEDDFLASAARAGASAPPLLAALATRSPTLGAGVMGASVFGPEFIEGVDQLGLGTTEAATRGALMSGIEAVAERIGLGALTKGGLDNILSKPVRELIESNYGAKVGGAIIANMGEELAATEAQFIADEAAGWKTYTPEEKAQARKDALIAGGLMGGSIRAVTALAERTGDPAVDAGVDAGAFLAKKAEQDVNALIGNERDADFAKLFEGREGRLLEESIAQQNIRNADIANAELVPDLFSGELTPARQPSLTEDAPTRNEAQQTDLERDYIFSMQERLQRQRALKKEVPRNDPRLFDIGVPEDASPIMAEAFRKAQIERAGGARIGENLYPGLRTPVDQATPAQPEVFQPTVPKTRAQRVAEQRELALGYGNAPAVGTTVPGMGTPAVSPQTTTAAPRQFKTAKGSVYTLYPDGTTERVKAPREGDDDSGPKSRTVKTIYVDPAVANAASLSAAGMQMPDGGKARVVLQDGKATLVTKSGARPEWGASQSARSIPFQTEPAVGLQPLELWQPRDDVNGLEAYGGMHAGNKITEFVDTTATIPNTAEVLSPPANNAVVTPSANRVDLDAPVSPDDVEAAALVDEINTMGQPVSTDVERSAKIARVATALNSDSSTKGLTSLPNVRIVTREDAPNLPEGVIDFDNDYGSYNPETGELFLNADLIPEGEEVAVALHEVAHPIDQSGVKTGRRSVDNIVGEAARGPLVARVRALSEGGSAVAQEALQRAEGNDAEVLTYFVEAAKRTKMDKGKPLGRRIQQVLNDVVAAVRGYLVDKGLNFKVREMDILRAGEMMARDYVKRGGDPVRPAVAGETAPLRSRARPAQPAAQEKAKQSAQRATSGVVQTTEGLALDPTTLGANKPLRSGRLGEKSWKDSKPARLVAENLSAIAGKNRELFEFLKQSMGEFDETVVLASQSMNRTADAIDKAIYAGQSKRSKRGSLVPDTRRQEIVGSLTTLNAGYDDRGRDPAAYDKARELLSTKYPEVFNVWQQERTTLDQMTVRLMKNLVNKPGGMTYRDIALVKQMKKNMGQYLTRQYKVNLSDKIRNAHIEKVTNNWTQMRGMTPEQIKKVYDGDKRAFFDAKEWVKRNVIDIGDYNEVLSAAKEDLDVDTIARLSSLYSMWVPKELRTELAAESTIEQRSEWVNKVTEQLKQVKASLSNAEYLAELEKKAIDSTDAFLRSFQNNDFNPLVSYVQSLRGEGGILKQRQNVPEPIRRLMGEVTEPLLQLHSTHIAMGKELARQGMLNAIYANGEGSIWIDPAKPGVTDAQLGAFSATLKGDKFGPLDGMRVPQMVADQLAETEALNVSLDAFLRASDNPKTKATIALEAGLNAIQFASTKWKLAQIVWNTGSAIRDFASTNIAIAGDGHVPYANKEARDFAFGAAWNLVNSVDRKSISDSAREVLRNRIADSSVTGEIQAADLDKASKRFLTDFANNEEAQSFLRKFANKATGTFERLGYVNRVVADTKAMSDLVGKFYNYAMEKQYQMELDKARKKDNPNYKMRSPKQIQSAASAVIDDTNIGYHRAMPAGKVIDRVGFGLLMNFITETARTTVNKFTLAGKTFQVGAKLPEGSAEKALVMKRGLQRFAGAVAYAGANTAMIAFLANTVAQLYAAVSSDDEDEKWIAEQLALIEDFRDAARIGEKSKAWVAPHIVNGRLFILDASQFDLSSTTSQGVMDILGGLADVAQGKETDKFERAADLGMGLFIMSPLGRLFNENRPTLNKTDPEFFKALQSNFGEDAARRLGHLYDVAMPRQARQLAQVPRESTPMGQAPLPTKIALGMGFGLRMYDPKFDLAGSTFEYKETKDKYRASVLENVRDDDGEEAFTEDYLEGVEAKIEESKHILANIKLARAIGADDALIEQALTKGFGQNVPGAGLSKGDVANLLGGVPTSVLLEEKDLDAKMKSELLTTDDPIQQRAIKQKYARYTTILNKLNEPLQAPQDAQKKTFNYS